MPPFTIAFLIEELPDLWLEVYLKLTLYPVAAIDPEQAQPGEPTQDPSEGIDEQMTLCAP